MLGVDGFLVYYEWTGGYIQWVARISSASNATSDFIYGMGLDTSGNAYVGGQGGAITAYNADGSSGGSLVAGAFLVKYSSAGVVQWLASQRATQASRVSAVAVDSSGNAYVGGSWGSLAASSSLSVYNANGTLFGTFPAVTQSTAWIAKYNSSGDVQWIARPAVGPAAGAPGNPTSVNGLAVDSSGSLYVVGSAAVTATITAFNANGTAFGTTISVAAGDAFITKYNSSGSVQWITKIASANSDQANAIAIDSQDNVYVVGTGGVGTITAFNASGSAFATTIVTTVGVPFIVEYNTSGTVQAVLKMLPASGGSGGAGFAVSTDRLGSLLVGGSWATNTTYTTTITDAGGVATVTGGVHLAKFNASGGYQWAQRWDGTGGSSYVSAIAADSNCDILVGGSVSTTGSIYDANPTVYGRMPTAPGAPPYVLYLVKYSSAAMPQWIAQVQFSTTSRARGGVSTDSSGNVYVTMGSRATVTPYSVDSAPKSLVTPGGTAFGSFSFGGTIDGILLVKYSSAGAVQWMARITSTSSIGTTQLMTRTDTSGNTYVAFQYSATVTARSANGTAFGTTIAVIGSADIGLVKYDTNGTVQWVTRMGSTASDSLGGLFADSSGNVYVTGGAGAATFTSYSSSGTAFSPTLPSTGLGDVFLVKYDTSGTVQWNARIASTNQDSGMGITCDSAGNVIVTGYCNSGGAAGTTTTARNANGTAFATTITNAGSGDGFVVKYNSTGTVQWVARISTTTALDYGTCVATDSANDIYVGAFPGATGTVTVVNANASTRTFANNLAGQAGIIVKFSAAGASQWIAYGNGRDRGVARVLDLVVDSSNRIYARYISSGVGLLHFDAGGAVAGVTPTTTSTAIVGLNTSGLTSWITPIPATTLDSFPPSTGPFLAGDSSGNFYVWCTP
jgi:hypothetical protein